MIIQIWQGITLLSSAEEYQTFLREKVLPSYQRAPGSLGVYLCREVSGGLVNFLLLALWSSSEALDQFAASGVAAVPRSPPQKKLLLAFQSVARNYEVLQSSK